MMSLEKVNFWSLVRKQFTFKWKSNIDMLTGLAILQVIALIFSSNGTGTFMHFSGVQFHLYTSDILVVFTMIWLLAIGIQVLRPINSVSTYTMVANRVVDHLSNVIWLIVMSGIGTITVLLASTLLQLINRYITGGVHVLSEINIPLWNYMMGAGSIFFYLLLAGAAGYFFGVLSQWNAGVKVLLPVILIGGLLFAPMIFPEDLLIQVFSFIFLEKTFYAFVLKVGIVSAILFVASISIGNRLEVRK